MLLGAAAVAATMLKALPEWLATTLSLASMLVSAVVSVEAANSAAHLPPSASAEASVSKHFLNKFLCWFQPILILFNAAASFFNSDPLSMQVRSQYARPCERTLWRSGAVTGCSETRWPQKNSSCLAGKSCSSRDRIFTNDRARIPR